VLLGRGALANYHDVPAEHEADFDHWHTTEHLPERVAVPGFLRGRRCRALDGGLSPRYFILYETADVEVLRSPAYVARLDQPTPRTTRASARMTRTIRTAARVVASAGTSLGGTVLTARLDPPAGEVPTLRATLEPCAIAALAATPGLCGVHVLEADASISAVPTAERALRDPPDELAPWTVLIEGTDPAPVAQAWARLRGYLPPSTGADAATGTYAVQAVVALCDV
jgi:hypothetical protein